MKIVRDRLGIDSERETGLSLIEVMVAMFIFGLVAMGLIFTMTSVLVLNRDSRVRQVAANLAAQEIDLARDVEDVPNFGGGTRTITLNGDTFTVDRISTWEVNPAAVGATCGTGGGTLKYKRIRVEVSWGGMRGSTGVVSDTFINPNERVNHPDFGTIMVTVKDVAGNGLGGVTVNATPDGGGSVTTSATTDANGCAYLLMVPPGTYDLTLVGPSGENYIDISLNAEPVEVATSLAGVSSTSLFEVDVAGILDVDYLHDGTTITNMQLPTNLGTSLISTYDTVLSERDKNSRFPKIPVAPFTSFTLIAGDIRDCLSADPQQWPETLTQFEGERGLPVSADSGVTTDVVVPMRLVWVDDIEDRYVTAVSQDSGPGCNTTITLRFSEEDDDDDRLIALPYGHWNLYKGNSPGSTSSNITSGDIDVYGNDTKTGRTVSLDPRVNK